MCIRDRSTWGQYQLMKTLEHDANHLSEEQRTAIRREGYRVIVGGICIHLILGTFYLWGGIVKYVASYLHSFDDTVSAKEMLGVFPYMGLCINCTTSIGVKVAQRIGHKLLVIIGICCISATVFICSFITNYTLFVLVYSIGFGVSAGMIYMTPLECALKYFPNKKGKISGIIIAGFGLGSFIFNFVTLALVNPDDKHPNEHTKLFEEDVYSNVPKMFRVLAICYLALGGLGVFLIKYPRELHLELYDEHNVLTKVAEKKTQDQVIHNECQSFKDGVKSRPFFFLFTMALLSTYAGFMMAGCYKTYGFDLGKSDSFLTITGSLQALSNGFSRAIWGLVLDKLGFKKVYQIILIAQLALMATINYVTTVDALFLIWVCATMGLEGGQFSIFPAFVMKLFGHKVGSVIYGIVFIAFALANLNSYLILNRELESIGWDGLWWIAFGYTVLAFTLLLFFKPEHQWSRKMDLKVQDPHHIAVHSDEHHDDDHHDDDHHDDNRRI
eukprot:TRINITY_DN403_c0_g1_i7.p1 TRINITY_DN403_c0_g1~~TRINITY_DN403_c0_g1_i7.p1  ORF type:complete len:499 (+),score=56.73 TRINITY_DN403_c0_g1_i7:70-1566(+)